MNLINNIFKDINKSRNRTPKRKVLFFINGDKKKKRKKKEEEKILTIKRKFAVIKQRVSK